MAVGKLIGTAVVLAWPVAGAIGFSFFAWGFFAAILFMFGGTLYAIAGSWSDPFDRWIVAGGAMLLVMLAMLAGAG